MRQAVGSSLVTQCKCHGVSGSCNIKTCWRALPTLAEIGERLKRKFAVATEVISRRVGAGRKLLPASSAMGLYNEDDLIYMTKSPDYCIRDARIGSLGTTGRYVPYGTDLHNCMPVPQRHYTPYTVNRLPQINPLRPNQPANQKTN